MLSNKNEKVFLVCKECGHKEEVNKKFFVKLAGAATSALGFKAWLCYLFAGTGCALFICATIIAGGVAMLAYADQITHMIASKYNCPKCKHKNWELVPESTLEEKLMRIWSDIKHKQEIENKETQFRQEKEASDFKHQQEIKGQKAYYEKKAEDLKRETLEVDQLREKFWQGLNSAHTEIDIHVPFIGHVFKREEFKKAIRNALKKGVKVKVRCGYGTPEEHENLSCNKNGDPRYIENTMENFKKKLSVGNEINNFSYVIGNSHAKLFIIDDDFYVIGSMNFLSYDGKEYKDLRGIQHRKSQELGELSRDKNQIEFYRKKYFSF